jgi:hypothetical protein
MAPGLIAAVVFLLLTGTGGAAQIVKISSRGKLFANGELPEDEIYAGLHPVREFWSFSGFLSFALAGLTRPTPDWFLIVSRTPIIVLSTGILYLLARHRAPGAGRLLVAAVVGNCILLAGLIALPFGLDLGVSPLPMVVDTVITCIGFSLFAAKISQARQMVQLRRSAGVSWAREIGFLLKDITGLWYAVTVGGPLFFVGLTHSLSIASSLAIVAAKLNVERKSLP